jgi:hypothetical protein
MNNPQLLSTALSGFFIVLRSALNGAERALKCNHIARCYQLVKRCRCHSLSERSQAHGFVGKFRGVYNGHPHSPAACNNNALVKVII